MPDAAGWAGACLAVVAALPEADLVAALPGAGLVASIREAGLVAVLPEAIPVVASPGAVAVCRMGAVVLGESCPYPSLRVWLPSGYGGPHPKDRPCRLHG